MLLSVTRRLVASLVLAALPCVATAQGIITLRADSARRTIAPSSKVTVPVILDMSAAGGTNLASLTTGVTFGASRLTFDSVKTAGFGSLTPNTTNAASGSLILGVIDATGTTTTQTLATMYFTASATTGGTTIVFSPTVAGSATGANIFALLRARALDICVAPSGKWGDVNGDSVTTPLGDGNVNIIDAQQIARYSVGLSVSNRPGLVARGDVTNDGAVNIIDAQQIARFSVGLSAAARVNTSAYTPPPVSTVTLLPGTPTVAVGQTVQLTGTALDAASNPLTGCAVVTYASSDTTKARVSSTGLVSGIAVGTATITASSGGQSAQVTVTVNPNIGGPVASLELVDGSDLATSVNVVAGAPVRVRARNALGGIVPSATVTFTVTSGPGLLGPVGAWLFAGAGAVPVPVITDTAGIATALLWSTATAPNTTTYAANATGATAVAFTLNALVTRLGANTCMNDGWSIRCWGDGTRGQLGNGTNTSSTSPVAVTLTGVSVGANSMISQEGFGDHTCLTDNAGAAWCWGSNNAGQLGDSTYTNRNVPTRVKTTLAFRTLVTGAEHSCGLTTSGGQIWCWGYNGSGYPSSGFGQLGDGTVSNRRFAPVQVKAPAGVVFTALTAGAYHTCGGTASGTWYCWGSNFYGQLGDGSTVNRSTPVVAANGMAFQQVDAGEAHSCGLTAAGAAFCWGNQNAGALGNGQVAVVNVTAPVAVNGGHAFTSLYLGSLRSCATEADLSVWCWGWNAVGQLADSTSWGRPEPVRAAFTGSALRMGGTSLTSAYHTTCGLTTTTQQVFCWGGNATGTIGDGTTTTRFTPVLVPRASGTAGAPAAISPVTPLTAATLVANSSLPAPGAQVLLRDALGTPVPGATVTWTVLSGAVTLPGNLATATSQTDAGGIATSGALGAGASMGGATLQASVPGTSPSSTTGPVRHVVTLFVTSAPASYTKVSGDSVFLGGLNTQATTVPVRVRVADGANNPVPNTAVIFSLGANSGTLSGSTSNVSVVTDANGVATLVAGTWAPNLAANAVSTLHAQNSSGSVDLVFTAFASSLAFANPLTSCELSAAGAAYCFGLGAQGQIGNGASTQQNAPTLVSGGLVFASLAPGASAHRCGLVGTVAYCWGLNDAGQLGDGTQVNRNVPTAVTGGLAFSQLATGNITTCGLITGNQLYCWGWSGTAGFEGATNQASRGRVFKAPQLVNTGGLTFTKVTVADDAVCGLTAAGTLHCRGAGSRGWNLDGSYDDRVTFTQATGGPWKDVSAMYLGVCAIDANDKVSCAGADQGLGSLGNGSYSTGSIVQPLLLPVASTLTFASIHNYHFGACARRSNGDVYCWGNNGLGQAGSGAGQSVTLVPTLIAGLSFASVRPMAFRTVCGKGTNAVLYCWGQNSNGQAGLGSAANAYIFTPAAVSGWPDGPAAGTATSAQPNTPAQSSGVVGQPVTVVPSVVVKDRTGAAVPGVTVTFAVTAGGGSITGATAQTDASGIATVGSWTLGPAAGTLNNVLTATVAGLPVVTFGYTAIPPAAAINIVNGNNQYLADFVGASSALWVQVLDASNNPINGAIVTWTVTTGNGTVSATTSTTATNTPTGATSSMGGVAWITWTTPTAVGTAYTVTALVPGLAPVTFTLRRFAWSNNGAANPQAASCRLRAGIPYCMGGNAFGAVGDGTNTNRNVPTAVSGGVTFASMGFTSFGYHQCALTAAGAAYCWGKNDVGQLGDGTQADRNVPTLVSGGIAFTQLYAGSHTTCGTTAAGQLYCWGFVGWSYLGDGSIYQMRTAPTLVNSGGRSFSSVSVGLRNVCALDASGQAWCWGENWGGHLGTGTTSNSPTPIATNTALRFTQIGTGLDHTCGVTTGSTVACWGYNANGAIGNGTTVNQTTPLVVGGISGAQEVHVGQSHTCARTPTQIWCWGANWNSQVGDGTTTSPRTSPVQVGSGVTGVTALAAGSNGTTCAVTASQMYCWGQNSNGTAGVGSFANVPVPTVARWPDAPVGTAAMIVPQTSTAVSAPAGMAVAPDVKVKVTDAFGTAVAGATVDWAVVGANGSVTPASSVTDTSGFATATWTLTGAVGAVNGLEARVTGLPSAVFTGTVAAPPASITITAGDQQAGLPNWGFLSGLSVLVKDSSNNVMANVPVITHDTLLTKVLGRCTLQEWRKGASRTT